MKKIITLFLALFLVFNLCTPFMAADSPVAIDYYFMQVTIEGHGHAEIDKNKVPEESREVVTFTAKAGEGDHFVGWKFKGDYIVVEGHHYSPVMKIIPVTDIAATAVFTNNNNKPVAATVDTSLTSPQTGQSKIPIYIALSVLVISALIVMFINKKKIK